MATKSVSKKIIKWAAIAGLLFLSGSVALYFYYFSLKYDDTVNVKADFSVEALPFIKSFEVNSTEANKKYREKIISLSGRVSKIEPADTTLNIKFIDSTTGSYAIFAFQKQHLAQVNTINKDDSVIIKGSCSGGEFSEILGTVFITFKRSVLEKKF